MTIDGRAFVGNTPVFRAKVGDVVQWDVLAIGDDFHTFHVHGHRWMTADGPRDTQTVGPAESYKIRWREDIARNVALPLPRREPHDERDDRDLPGDGMRGHLLLLLPVVGVLALAPGAASADAPTRTVTMPGKLYDPSQLTVLVGTIVTWKNDDSTNHTVTADGDAFSSGYVPPGGSFSFTFAKQGRYAFHCTIHKFMRGEVDVFGLVLSGPEAPVASGQRVVFAGLAPPGTESVTLRGATTGDRVVRARPDGSFVAAVDAVVPGRFRAVAGRLVSPVVPVQVRPAVRAARTGATLHARAAPARPGATAVLQTYDRDHFTWRGIARSKLDGRSRTVFRLPAGLDRVRVLVVGTKGWADGVSQTVRLRDGA